MDWTMYRVTLRLLSPLHVGYLKQGNVQRTRPYVTGRALWGALTARLTRDSGSNDYQRMGRQVNDTLAFSYFFPSTEKEEVILFPWDNPDEFAWHYLHAYASTALDYSRNAALEGSLHETEYIAPVTREGEPVYLVGFIFENSNCSLKWKDALKFLPLGGERTYGWGQLRMEGEPKCPGSFWPDWEVDLNQSRPLLRFTGASSRAYAHMKATGVAAQGLIEPLVGRETRQADSHGETLSQAVVCWVPGASLAGQASLQIRDNGIWEVVQEP